MATPNSFSGRVHDNYDIDFTQLRDGNHDPTLNKPTEGRGVKFDILTFSFARKRLVVRPAKFFSSIDRKR
jgi:hypothetical protein